MRSRDTALGWIQEDLDPDGFTIMTIGTEQTGPGELCYVTLKVNGKPLQFMLDTGASISCIGRKAWNRINGPEGGHIWGTDMRIRAANEGYMDVQGMAVAEIQIDEELTIKTGVFIIGDLSVDAILGTDIIFHDANYPSGVRVDEKGEKYLELRGVRVRGSWQKNLRAHEDYYLPPGSHREIWLDAEGGLDTLMETVKEDEELRCVAELHRQRDPALAIYPLTNTVYYLKPGKYCGPLPALIANITDKPLTVHKGMLVASLEPAQGTWEDIGLAEPRPKSPPLPQPPKRAGASGGNPESTFAPTRHNMSTVQQEPQEEQGAPCDTRGPPTDPDAITPKRKIAPDEGKMRLRLQKMRDPKSETHFQRRKQRRVDQEKRAKEKKQHKRNTRRFLHALSTIGWEFSEADNYLKSRQNYIDKLLAHEDTALGPLRPGLKESEDTIGKPPDTLGAPGNSENRQKPVDELILDLVEDSVRELETEEQRETVKQFIINHQHCFSLGKHDIGRVKTTVHPTELTPDAKPFRQPPRRMDPQQAKDCQEMVEQMEESGVVSKGYSPFASGIVMVKKKDGSNRMCVDYRQLNEMTVKDAWPLPRIDDTLDRLAGAFFLCALDITSAYYQVELKPEDRYKTAFVTPNGQYCYNVLPFGLCNAPATFSRLMAMVTHGLPPDVAHCYLDDVIVIGQDFDSTIENLHVVLERFYEAGLKFGPSKCKLFRREVGFLGHIVGRDGIKMDPSKIEALINWPIPKTKRDVQVFIGFANYYRRFVPRFSELAFPLTRCMSQQTGFAWTPGCQEAFEAVKIEIKKDTVLAFPDFSKPFILHTDASDVGVGAALVQEVDQEDGTKVERPIAFYSKTLTKEGRNYCVTRRELLAVVLATQNFRPYLGGKRFTIKTDHSSLRWLRQLRSVEGQLARWQALLQEFDFAIEHRAGKLHGDADGLSRRPCEVGVCKHCDKADFYCRTCGAVDGEFADDLSDPTTFSAEELKELSVHQLWEIDDDRVEKAGPAMERIRALIDEPHWDPPLGRDEYLLDDFINGIFVHDRDFALVEPINLLAEMGKLGIVQADCSQYARTPGQPVFAKTITENPEFSRENIIKRQQEDPHLRPVFRQL